ncbi:potassium-transporting ATPase subunit KdpC [Cupriavidus oxalaticus]|uniref:Potassium-transporting ATPase KdpC subunit n=1 Tax=Cupriavidus oxalaticus TaxID=96344 RepID=A0A375G0R8_9BURK|nr:potassium-transporting ATPase subunit KdpC [Cupriavidus oxalaticus]QRQ85915.1 potassium-transporting ATPase subunit KdpC [Cupriavidus oxalaticus]QRQ95759.1 potassium-transporting ATPase subunit KdpC [Cupriavidus oxalaticus]WQD84425.1 potassium-transporting ATPase subunit KdpC [Cupriavidus oxalaticus]SPC06678.1 P-type ATPase, high-affinity potassium transport system, C chain [Cupriavidus oxalaticus]SPC12337.1 potassium translocating ATPase, subunit C [Cupriavidus oxalaticus]
MKNLVRPAVSLFLLLSILTGLAYPVAITGVARLLFPRQAAGSLIQRGNEVVGSELIGQSFSGKGYFWSRPSATAPMPNNAASSGGSNLGPTNPALVDAVKARVDAARAAHPYQTGPVPADLVTASASGLDPHISPAAAYYQVDRVAKARGMLPAKVRQLVDQYREGPSWGIFGDSTVNVLKLNLALDKA